MITRYPLFVGSFLLVILSCGDSSKEADQSTLSGSQLAQIHCASCHQYPEPNLLDRNSWKVHVLPRMGFMIGILPEDSIGSGFIENNARKVAFQNPSLFRQEPALTRKEWAAIRDFYLQEAPEQPIRAPKKEVQSTPAHFKVHLPETRLSPPSTTLVKFVGNQLFIGDAHSKRLYQFDKDLQLLNVANTGEGLVDLIELSNTFILTIMGSFSPTDKPTGKVISLAKQPEQGVHLLLDSLRRPVHATLADLNADGRQDLITCEFAKWTGRLSWWENQGDGIFIPHLLRNMPGAIRTYARDFNQDGLMDIIALFGQGDEGIFIYYNQGNGTFQEERVLRFPPANGSSFFDLFDANQDGHLDILYTAGDNADFTPVLKAYHGIYIYLNDGQNQFKQSFFYPLYGAYGAVARDFDLDGDVDLAGISFFPDFVQEPQSGFVYLQNQGNFEFTATTFPEVDLGRWIVMDAGDTDGDGDVDLVLGSLAFEVIPDLGLVKKWTEGGIPFVILENTIR